MRRLQTNKIPFSGTERVNPINALLIGSCKAILLIIMKSCSII